ncbi:MAG TPA: hypothetical protein VLT59_01050 [Steroidobacteraceae bacterium]|nr:hypothetical protein [Steroidobacteraceae bacterium]
MNRTLLAAASCALAPALPATAAESATEPFSPVAEIVVTGQQPRVADKVATIDVVTAGRHQPR